MTLLSKVNACLVQSRRSKQPRQIMQAIAVIRKLHDAPFDQLAQGVLRGVRVHVPDRRRCRRVEIRRKHGERRPARLLFRREQVVTQA